MPKNRENFTTHGLHMNWKGKTWLVNKWTSLILAMVARIQNKVATPLPWTEGKDNVVDLVIKNTLSLKVTKPSTRQNSNQV
jgi:hypothetical protein